MTILPGNEVNFKEKLQAQGKDLSSAVMNLRLGHEEPRWGLLKKCDVRPGNFKRRRIPSERAWVESGRDQDS